MPHSLPLLLACDPVAASSARRSYQVLALASARAEADPYIASDPVILINPRDVDLVIERLRVVADEANAFLRSRGQSGKKSAPRRVASACNPKGRARDGNAVSTAPVN